MELITKEQNMVSWVNHQLVVGDIGGDLSSDTQGQMIKISRQLKYVSEEGE